MLINKKTKLIKTCLLTSAFFSSMNAHSNFDEVTDNRDSNNPVSQLIQVPNQNSTSLTNDADSQNDLFQNDEMYHAINEYYTELGYSFSEAECLIEQKSSLLFEQQPISYNLTTSSCAELLLSKHGIIDDQPMAFLVQVELNDLSNENKEETGRISIKSLPSHQPLIQREIKLNSFQDAKKELMVIGNNCSSESCDALFDVQSLNAFAEVEVTIKGVFYRDLLSSSKLTNENDLNANEKLLVSSRTTSGFQNGNFNQNGTGWAWKTTFLNNNNCTSSSAYLGDIGDPINPIISTLPGNNKNGVTRGGFGSTEFFEEHKYSSIAQTVQVNPNTRLKFRYRLQTGKVAGGYYDLPVSMIVRAFDITTGNSYYTYQRTTNNAINFVTRTRGIGLLWNHTVRFSFNVCSSASQPSVPFSDQHGWMGIDDVQLEAFTPPSPSGTLSTNSPCTLVYGSNQCTVQLDAATTNSPINCLWKSQPQITLFSCTGDPQFTRQWNYANTAGHTFDLRSHTSFPANTAAEFNQSVLLDREQVLALPAPTPDIYDDISLRGYSDDAPGDAERIFATAPAQQHNFHDQGDEDWTIFAIGNGAATISTTVNGNAVAQLRIYEVTGDYSAITPDRWDITLSDLTLRDSDTSAGNNSVTVSNDSNGVKVYVVRANSSGPFGNNTGYSIRATVL